MTRVLFDVDVLLDVIEERKPHVAASAAALGLAERGRLHRLVSARTLPTRLLPGRQAPRPGRRIRERPPADAPARGRSGGPDRIEQALAAGWPDFEEAVQAACALDAGADVLVTRNVRDYRDAAVAVETPEQLLARLGSLPPD